MQILSGRRHRVESIVFSPCGRWLAAGNAGGFHLWDTSNPTIKPRRQEDHAFGRVGDLSFRPNGQLFYRDLGNRCHLVDPEQAVLNPSFCGQYNGEFILSPDGQLLVRVQHSSPLRSWIFGKTGKLNAALTRVAEAGYVRCAAFSPDGKVLATVDAVKGGRDPLLVLRSAATLKKTSATTTYRDAAQVIISWDGTKLFIRSAASIACYDVSDPVKAPRKIVNPSRKHFVSMAVHPDGKLLTADNDALVRVWDISTLTQVRTVEWKIGGLYAVAVSPDGTRAATGGSRGKVLVWDWD